RRSRRASRRSRTGSGSDGELATSKRSSTAVATLLTFWPPAPLARMKRSTISLSGISMSMAVAGMWRECARGAYNPASIAWPGRPNVAQNPAARAAAFRILRGIARAGRRDPGGRRAPRTPAGTHPLAGDAGRDAAADRGLAAGDGGADGRRPAARRRTARAAGGDPGQVHGRGAAGAGVGEPRTGLLRHLPPHLQRRGHRRDHRLLRNSRRPAHA